MLMDLSGPVLESCAQLWSAHRFISGVVSKECAYFLVRAPAGNLPEYLQAKFGRTHYEQDLVIVVLQLFCRFWGLFGYI